MDHAAFILWAYVGVAILIAALIFYVAWNARRIAKRLAALEAKGIRRRSTGKAS